MSYSDYTKEYYIDQLEKIMGIMLHTKVIEVKRADLS